MSTGYQQLKQSGKRPYEKFVVIWAIANAVMFYLTYDYWFMRDMFAVCFGLWILTGILIRIKYRRLIGPSGIAVHQLDDFKTQYWSYEKHMSVNICSLCLEIFTPGSKIIILECDNRHLYHDYCIKYWLWEKLSCPTCRAPISIN